MNTVSDETRKLMIIGALPGVGPKSLWGLKNHPNFKQASVEDLISILKIKNFDSQSVISAMEFANRNADFAEKMNHKIISFFDSEFPLQLSLTKDAPAYLFCSGDVGVLNKKKLAIIGTRQPTEHGRIIAKNITLWFAAQGWNIVSGLAIGVDSIAHEAAIASPSKTIAVMAQGLDKIYPAENKGLAKRIVDSGGVLVTEYPYDSMTFKTNFVQRDRIQAGLSAGVIMIQSDLKGGSMHASRAILKYERLLIVPNQSKLDIYNKEPKIEANLLFIHGDKNDVLKHLKSPAAAMKNIMVMHNKSEYKLIHNKLIELNESISIHKHDSFDF